MKSIRTFAAGALAVGLISLLGMGCELVASPDHGLLEGSSSGTGGSGGSGPECTDAAVDCPDTGSECIVATCEGGVCGTMQLPEGTAAATQTPADCQTAQCDAAGEVVNVPDDTDVADDMNECTDNLCDMGTVAHPPVADGTSCAGGRICVTGVCSDRTCMDTFKDGTETDVDCGGACPPCGDNLGCGAGVDCQSGVCTGGTCTPPACDDQVKNQDETDVDCGGFCGATCADGAVCLLGSDCSSGVCADDGAGGLACQSASCSDGALNGDETDTDCGGSCSDCVNGSICMGAGDCQSNFCSGGMCSSCNGNDGNCVAADYCNAAGVCVPDDANGAACSAAAHCTSNNCVDGVCCNTACGALCQACDVAGSVGTCSNVPDATDPANECANGVQCKTGSCDGNGACGNSPANTTCGSAASCAAGVQTNQDLCNAGGTCVDNGTTNCGNFICGATACKTICAVDADCVSGNYCNAGNTCVPKAANGGSCAANNQCNSGFCTDGVCCNSACNAGGCDACSVAAGAAVDGTCSIFTAGATGNPSCSPYVCGGAVGACPVSCSADANCIAGDFCNGANVCTPKLAQGAACTANNQCTGGNCVDGFCCSAACGGLCQACSNAKTGQANGLCSPVTNATDPDNECANGVACKTGTCNGAGACGNSPLNTTCGSSPACAANVQTNQDLCDANGNCVDNGTTNCVPYICGPTACKTTCAGVDSDCQSTHWCNVTVCTAKGGTGAACTANNQCTSNVCTGGTTCQ